MAWTQTDLNQLDAAIASGRGVRSLTFSDQSVTFNSIDDMLKLRAAMQASIRAAASEVSTRWAAMSKGV